MKVPLSWLKDYVDIDTGVETLADKLTAVGVPVEGIEYISPDVTGVVAGQILAMRRHPNADRLMVCDVDMGGDSPLQIITAATNVREGNIVPVALDGANLYGDIKIKSTKMRGEASFGMMCSAKELGLDIKDLPVEQREGVLILPDDTPAGASIIDLFCLHDPILVFETFANRPDQLSILGIAREVAAVLGKQFIPPPLDFPVFPEKASDVVKIKIENYDLCKKYSGRIITDMPIKKSPLWMQGRLYAAGIRSINNVVDVTNYVMIETGQPLHAFDFASVKGGIIKVRPARDGEIIKSIDGEERKLDPSMLVIADENNPIAIAGVMGGLESEVNDSTVRILLESASFNPASIRRTSIRLALRSESSRRFEKGIDYHQVDFASRRACRLLAEMGGKVLSGEAVDAVEPPEQVIIKLRPSRVNRVLGTDLEPAAVKRLLKSLDFGVEPQGDTFFVVVPTIRKDINEEIDLIEEVARLYGYDKIPTTMPCGEAFGAETDVALLEEELRDRLTRLGLYECVTLSLYEEKVIDQFRINDDNLLRIKNPIIKDQAVMRADATAHLMEVVKRNIANRRNVSRLFEIGKFYRDLKNGGEPEERRELTILLTGPEGSPDVDFFALKGILELVFSSFCIEAEYEKAEVSYLHPGKTARIFSGDTTLGQIGILHPAIAHKLEIEQEICLAKVSIDVLFMLKKTKKYKPILKFPCIQRDIAVVLDKDVPAVKVKNEIMKNGLPIIDDSYCFDVYQGTQIPPDKKSLAFTLSFSAEDRTLTDAEVQEKIDAILSSLKKEFNASLRS